MVSAMGKGNPEYASSHLLNRMTAGQGGGGAEAGWVRVRAWSEGASSWMWQCGELVAARRLPSRVRSSPEMDTAIHIPTKV